MWVSLHIWLHSSGLCPSISNMGSSASSMIAELEGEQDGSDGQGGTMRQWYQNLG